MDIVATTAFAPGADAMDWIAERPHLQALVVRRDGHVWRSPNWAESAGWQR